MKTVCELNKCNGCMVCLKKCPQKCIEIVDMIEAYNAVIDYKKCVNCNICKNVCPNINKVKKTKPILWYQGWRNDDTRVKSSSGGIASAIIERFIENGGYVASCIYENGDFPFLLTNSLNEAKKFYGSKYVKSNPNGIYEKIEKIIDNNRVLFIGLPCQVAALKNRIKNQKNLFTIDLICHGTPSPKLLEMYLNEEKIEIKQIKNIQFRNKVDFGVIVNDEKITLSKVMDEYLCAFLNSINYTENCYTCDYACIERVGDITLGDSWGSKLENEKKDGISLVLIQNEKGKELMEGIEITIHNVDIENAIKNNKQLLKPSTMTPNRKKFFKLVNNKRSFKCAVWRTLPKVVVKQKIKYILIKLHLL